MTARHPGRPPIVVLTIAVAALAGLPTAAAVPVAPQPSTARAAAVPRLADAGSAVESIRFNPVAFRVTGAPLTSPAPAAVAAVVASQPQVTTTAAPGTAAARAIEFALAQRGLPYVWGGNGPQQGDAGFDCSGLTTAAYAYAGIDLPRTAHTQYYAGPHVPDGAPLEPGDLVFYGVPERVHHVGLYVGEGRMVNAPTFGQPVRLAYVRYDGDDYLGATRPAAGIDAPAEGLLDTPDLPVDVPPVPSPAVPPAPEEFAAPEVPATDLPAPDLPAPDLPAAPPTDGADLAEVAPPGPDPAGAGGTIADGPGVTDGPTAADGPGSADGTAPPTGPTPSTGTAPPIGTAPPTGPAASTDPSLSTDPSRSTGTASPADTGPSPGTAPPAGTTPPANTGTPAPADGTPPGSAPPAVAAPPVTPTPPGAPPTTTPEPTPATPTASATPAEPAPTRPTSLTLPGATDLALAAAELGPDGLPVAPTAAGTGGLRWSPAEGERTARATVALHPGTDVSTLTPGAPVTLRGEDGTTTALTIRSRAILDAAGAVDRATGRGESLRLVLLRTDPTTGEVLVVIAE